jgi:hypothetical protein
MYNAILPERREQDLHSDCRIAARLIERAIAMCDRPEDMQALDCLLDARRALSPLIDGR